jgi:cytochrome c oxidase subunit 4
MNERKLLLGVSGIVILLAFSSVAYLGVMGMLAKVDGLSLALMALLIAAIFAVASIPEVLSMYPLPPAVDESAHEEDHGGATTPLFMKVWGGLLFLTAIEVAIAYGQPWLKLSVLLMLTALMGLSIVKAAMIIGYFMHLRFERLSLVLIVMPALVMCICLLGIFFPDSNRMRELGRDRQKDKDMLAVTEEKPASADGAAAGEPAK